MKWARAAMMSVIVSAFGLAAVQLQCVCAAGKVAPMNSLMVLHPYKYQGTWVFDDAAVDLQREPFIAGIDTMIDKLVAKIPDAERGFRGRL